MTLRPANGRWTFVTDKDLQKAGNYGLKNDGDSSLFQFGFLGTATYKVKLMENITLINTASVFSNYLRPSGQTGFRLWWNSELEGQQIYFC